MTAINQLRRPLIAVLGFLVCFALLQVSRYWLHPLADNLAAIFDAVRLPVVGRPFHFVARSIRNAASWVEHELARGATHFEDDLVAFFEGFYLLLKAIAHLFTLSPAQLWHALSNFWYYKVPDTVAKAKTAGAHASAATAARIATAKTAILPRLVANEQALARELHGLEVRVRQDEKLLAAAGAIALPLPGVIPREGTLTRPRSDTQVQKRVALLEKLLGTAAIAGIVAQALSRLGWQRQPCRSNRALQRAACRIPVKLLEDLLAGVIDVLILKDLCLIVSGLTRAAEAAQPVISEIATMTSELIACQHADRPAPLALRSSPLPPLRGALALR